MRRSLNSRGLASLLLLLSPAFLHAAEKMELQWKFKKGQVHKYLLKHREVRTVVVGDQKFETTTASEYELQWTVNDIDDKGVAVLEQKLTALRVTSTSTSFEFQYNSARGNQTDDAYKKKLVNYYDQLRFAGYRVRLKPDGRIVEVQGFDKVLGETGPDQDIANYHAINLHDGSFAWFLQQALGTLPEATVAGGGKWKVPVEGKLAEAGGLTGQVEFTLQEKPVQAGERTCQELRLTGAQALELDMKLFNNPLKGTLKTTKLAGAVRFDPKAGAVQNSEIQIEMSGDLKIGGGEKPAAFKVSFQHALELERKP